MRESCLIMIVKHGHMHLVIRQLTRIIHKTRHLTVKIRSALKISNIRHITNFCRISCILMEQIKIIWACRSICRVKFKRRASLHNKARRKRNKVLAKIVYLSSKDKMLLEYWLLQILIVGRVCRKIKCLIILLVFTHVKTFKTIKSLWKAEEWVKFHLKFWMPLNFKMTSTLTLLTGRVLMFLLLDF